MVKKVMRILSRDVYDLRRKLEMRDQAVTSSGLSQVVSRVRFEMSSASR